MFLMDLDLCNDKTTYDQFNDADDLGAALVEFSAAKEIALGVETTALTPWSIAEAPRSAAQLGNGMTTKTYAKKLNTTFNTKPRPRILSAKAVPAGRQFVFDLDKLDREQKILLVSALNGKVWVGHNLAFDLMWIRSIEPGVTPSYVIDTMLLTTTHAPDLEFAVRDLMFSPSSPAYLRNGSKLGYLGLPHTLKHGSSARNHMEALLAQRDGGQLFTKTGEPVRSLPLDFLSVALMGEKLSRDFQRPYNWMPAVLTAGHYGSCKGDITQPSKIARRLLGLPENADIKRVLDEIKKSPGGSAYDVFAKGAIRLTQMQRNGLYFSFCDAMGYIKKQLNDAERASERLIQWLPELASHRSTLLTIDKGLTGSIKQAFAAALTRLGGKAPVTTITGEPDLSAKSLKMVYHGTPADSAIGAYKEMGGALKRVSMAQGYLAQVDENSRLHSMVTISTVTGRTASQEPNLQNSPRDQDFRALFAAPSGKKIIAVDYSAIEMRIAAALAVRAYRRFRELIDLAVAGAAFEYRRIALDMGIYWFLGDLGQESAIAHVVRLIGSDGNDSVPFAEKPDAEGRDYWREHYARKTFDIVQGMHASGAFQQDKHNDRLNLADIFARGLDPHIITALSTESLAGRFDLRGQSPVEYVGGLSMEEAADLKMRLRDARQAAKAQNFGLLYGMQPRRLHEYGITSYGLSWTIEEAEFASQAWFSLYPEIQLWHLLTRYSNRKMFSQDDPQKRQNKLFMASTLTGRPVCSDSLPSALNFQDQGTGAEIALAAIANLPVHLESELVNFVHDELVFEVPIERADIRKLEIEQIMVDAADRVLKDEFGVPTSVEAEIGDAWIH